MPRVRRLLCGATLATTPLCALAWPDRPIELVVGFAAGGMFDVMARVAAQEMSQLLRHPVVVVVKDGAGGMLATNLVAKAPPDGHTLAFSAIGPLNLQPHLRRSMPYRADELAGVCQTLHTDLAIVAAPGSAFTSLQQVIAQAKKNPGRINYGVAGIGAAPHVAALRLQQLANVKMEAVAYRGDPAVLLAMKSGEIELGMLAPGSASGHGMRILAVLAPSRLKDLPDVPTAAEAGYAVSGRVHGGIYTPRGLPPEVKERLEAACRAVVESERFANVARSRHVVPVYTDAATFDRTIAETSAANREAIQAAGLTLD